MTLAEVLELISKDKGALTGVLAHIQKTDQGRELLENHAKAHFEQHLKPKLTEVHAGYDNQVFEVLGERRPDGKKAQEFIREKLNELKKLKGAKGSDKDVRIRELEKQLGQLKADGGQNGHWKRTHEEAVSKWDTERGGLLNRIADLEAQQLQGQVDAFLEAGLTGLEFTVPQEAVDALKSVHGQAVAGNAKVIDGKVVLHNTEGNPMLNDQYRPMTAKEYWQHKLASVIKGPNQGGGGAPGDQKGGITTVGEGESATRRLEMDRASFSSRHEFVQQASKILTAQGVEKESKEWNALMDTARGEYEVAKLPLH